MHHESATPRHRLSVAISSGQFCPPLDPRPAPAAPAPRDVTSRHIRTGPAPHRYRYRSILPRERRRRSGARVPGEREAGLPAGRAGAGSGERGAGSRERGAGRGGGGEDSGLKSLHIIFMTQQIGCGTDDRLDCRDLTKL
ncbi:hypothetical protein JYU34_001348 [Plutella xylostella]|uniref:Uncharacterized protein n=1 Tax=Plutella xylostella TaxID=51655 RepID=A0ABQ7R3R3_PLUXY|nr:hypothetical protein JYU34_001348 [Plutella xylostella]